MTKQQRLFLFWVLGTSLGPVLAALIGVALYSLLLPALGCEVSSLVGDMIHTIQWHTGCHVILAPTIVLCLAAPGLVQWAVLRSLGVLREASWILLTAMGWMGVLGIQGLLFNPPIGPWGPGTTAVLKLVFSALAGVILGVTQWIALRGFSSKAWVWIAVSAVGALLSGALAWGWVDLITWAGLLRTLLSLVPYGILTGLVLVWLLNPRASHPFEALTE